jgi:hypothetical protein
VWRRGPRARARAQAAPEAAGLDSAVIARVAVVTTVDPKLRAVLDEQRRVETLPHPPTMRLFRTLSLRSDRAPG